MQPLPSLSDAANEPPPAPVPDEAVLHLGTECNNRCQFCTERARPSPVPAPALADVVAQLTRLRQRSDLLAITGGEPTLRPDLFPIIHAARAAGFRLVTVETNGRRLAYLPFARAFAATGAQARVALHADTAEAHDSLTGVEGSFDQTRAGLANLRDLHRGAATVTVVLRDNARALPGLAGLLAEHGVTAARFVLARPWQRPPGAPGADIAVPAEAEPFVKWALDACRARGVAAWAEGFPPCVMSGYERFRVEAGGGAPLLFGPGRDDSPPPASAVPVSRAQQPVGEVTARREMSEKRFGEERENARIRGNTAFSRDNDETLRSRLSPGGTLSTGCHGPACPTCAAFDGCAGAPSEYAARFTWSAFPPVPRGMPAWARNGAAPTRAGAHNEGRPGVSSPPERAAPGGAGTETGTGDGDGDDQCAARVSRPAGDRSDPSDRSDRAARLLRAADFRRWRSVVLNITSRCALDCLFCNEKDFHFKAPDLTFEEIVARLEGYAREGYQSVCMMSGDVLLHRDFERVVEWIGKKQGMVPAFATTGERLDDLSFLESLVARGLRHIEFSLASHRPEDADLLAGRRGIGARQRRALANIGAVNGRADRPLIVSLNVILNSINAPYLRDTVAFALDALGRVDWVSLKAVQIAGNARRHPFLALPYHRLAPAAAVAAALLEERGENYFLDNFPLCALPRGLWERSQYAFLVRSGQRLRGENYDGRFDRGSDFAARGHDHDPVCSTCDAAPICPGFPGEYGRLFGEREKTALADVPAAADVA